MKFYPKDEDVFSDLPSSLIKVFQKVSLCHIAHWTDKRDSFSVAVAENMEPKQVITEVLDKQIHHLLQKNPERFSDDVFSVGRLVDDSNEYFQPQFKVFPEQAIEEVVLRFAGPTQKAEMKEKALLFLEKIKSPSVLQSAESIIEELYMNAVFDAPREASQWSTASSSSSAEIYLAFNEKSLQISCTDFYGSLDIEKFLSRMDQVYKKGMSQAIDFSGERGGGAGIGCVILFQNCSSFILGVQDRQMTKVTCVIPLGMRNRQREEMKKSIHWFRF